MKTSAAFFFFSTKINCGPNITQCFFNTINFAIDFVNNRSCSVLSAALAKSGPLDFPSEKYFLLIFAHEKDLEHMFQK